MLLAMMATAIMITHETIQMSQNRFHMAGHSLKKCDSYQASADGSSAFPAGRLTSTSLMVEAHCMLYPTKCARLRGQPSLGNPADHAYSAVVRCQAMPQKKKKKNTIHCRVSLLMGEDPGETYLEVADQGVAERVGVEPVLEDGRGHVRKAREHHNT